MSYRVLPPGPSGEQASQRISGKVAGVDVDAVHFWNVEDVGHESVVGKAFGQMGRSGVYLDLILPYGNASRLHVPKGRFEDVALLDAVDVELPRSRVRGEGVADDFKLHLWWNTYSIAAQTPAARIPRSHFTPLAWSR